jgi:hypothetical protein
MPINIKGTIISNTNEQPTISNGRGGDGRHNTVEHGRTHSREAEVDLVGEDLQK